MSRGKSWWLMVAGWYGEAVRVKAGMVWGEGREWDVGMGRWGDVRMGSVVGGKGGVVKLGV